MSRPRTALLLAVAAAVVLTGCGGAPSPSVEDPGGPDASALPMEPGLLVVEPPVAGPADRLALRFPQGTLRGIAFQLDRAANRGWETTHLMTSDANGGIAETVPAGAEGWGVDDVGIGGPGPDHVQLPEDVEPGDYRVCTANAGEDFCAPLTITYDGLACDSEMRQSAVIDYEHDPEPSGVTPVAAAENGLATEFDDDVTFREVSPTELEAVRPDGALVGTVYLMATTGGFVVSGYTSCG